jgi:DNA polymerase III subunit alpha
VAPWGIKERLTQEKTAVGFYLSGHLFDEVATEVRRFVRTPLSEVADSRDPQVLVGIVTDLRTINGQRGKLGLFRLDDKSGTIEASADENLLNLHRDTLKDDELVVLQGVVQNDRFSGGLRFKVQQVWDLPTARCRFAKYLRVAVRPDATGQALDVAALVRSFPPLRESTDQGELVRGLPVRLAVERPDVRCDVHLDDRSLFYPSDAALASWTAQAHQQRVELVYD